MPAPIIDGKKAITAITVRMIEEQISVFLSLLGSDGFLHIFHTARKSADVINKPIQFTETKRRLKMEGQKYL